MMNARQNFAACSALAAGMVFLFPGDLLTAGSGPSRQPRQKPAPAAEAKFSPEDLAFYEKEVRPVLEANCLRTPRQAGEKIRGGLRLDSRAALLKGVDLGPWRCRWTSPRTRPCC